MKQNQAAFTQGSIGGTMIRTAFAMLAGTLSMSGYNIADTYFVGQLGKVPMAAMGFTFPVIMLVGCVFHGLATGVTTTSAQALGGNRQEKASKLITSGIALITIISVVLTVLGMTTANSIFEQFGAAGKTLEETIAYMNIWYFGCVTAALSMGGNNLLVSVGDSKLASAMMVLGMLINAAADPIFIFGWGFVPAMGIRGAAIATILSQAVVTVVCLIILNKRHHLFVLQWIPWRQVRRSWALMIRFAIPATIGMLMMPIGSAIVTRITATFGDTAVAATAAAGRLEMLAFVFPMALGISLMPMIGQNYGARLYDRIRSCHKFSTWFAFTFLLGMAVLYAIFSPHIVKLFSPDQDVRDVMMMCMYIIPWGFGMIEIHRYSGFFYIGCGRPVVSAWLNALRILGLMIPLSLLAMYFHSLPGLFFARLAADVIAGSTGWILSKRMTDRLPQDGMPAPVPTKEKFIFSRIRAMLPERLRGAAVAQADIDSRSHTQ